MNSLALVETPAGISRLYYMTTLISNVLYKNSAVNHQTLATRIHRNIEAAHPPPPGQAPAALTFGKDLIGYTEQYEERSQVAEVQVLLGKLGYDVGKVDGKFGPGTAAGIRKFQQDHNLEVDGKVSEALIASLKAAAE